MLKCVLPITAAASAVLLIVTGALIVHRRSRMASGVECTGVIVDFYRDTAAGTLGSGNAEAISPVVRYTVNGRDYVFTANYATTSMKVGQRVQVLYSADDPSDAVLQKGLWVGPLITGVLCIACLLTTIICWILQSKGIG